MKILDKAITPNGIQIQLEDWSMHNTPIYPSLYGLTIGAYPIAKHDSGSGAIRKGKRFRLSICMNKYKGYTNDNICKDYEALKSGIKELKDLADYFHDGNKDKWILGMNIENPFAVKSVEYFKKLITKNSQSEEIRLQRCCEWIVLRPNDEKIWHGEEEFKNKVQAVEELLDTDKYINSELRVYYYDMKNNEHDFHDFNRWKKFGRKVG